MMKIRDKVNTSNYEDVIGKEFIRNCKIYLNYRYSNITVMKKGQ